MTVGKNPYSTQPGFGLRYYRAKEAYELYGRDWDSPPYSQAIDDCFEMNDGTAIAWALMYEAIAGRNEDLAEGIRRTGKNVWPAWLEVYEQRGKHAPRQKQLGLFTPAVATHRKPRSPSML